MSSVFRWRQTYQRKGARGLTNLSSLYPGLNNLEMLWTTYAELLDVVGSIDAGSTAEQRAILHDTAARIYRLQGGMMTDSVHAEIEHHEEQRYVAMIARDYAALERLLGDDILYTHSSAVTDTKRSYLDSLRSGRVRYLAAKRDGVSIRHYGDVAVVHGHAAIEAEINGERRSLDNMFVNVWVRRPAGWQMVHWASTAIPKK